FETTFIPLMTPVVILMMVGPFMRWKGDVLGRIVRKLGPVLLVSVALGLVIAYAIEHVTWRTVLGLTLAAWVVLGSVKLLVTRLSDHAGASAMTRLRGIPSGWWGMWLAHLGIGVFIIGVTMVGSLDARLDVKMHPGETATLAGYTFRLDGVADVPGPNYDAARATVVVHDGERLLTTLSPEKRSYRAQQMPMTEAALDIGLFRDVYVALGAEVDGGAWLLSLYHKPFISWIWFGCTLMGLGGVLAAADRRYRRLAERRVAAAAAVGQAG
ncbi:MAG: c-type cytochrome biogenesis protein CcmF, partial [Rhodocyclales bacterium]|nr:c-type cytochrome biogenesis protein CcmF [Rhodocyclales bacterium]